MKVPYVALLFLAFFSSCCKDREGFKIVRDDHFYMPPHRFSRMVRGEPFFSLDDRYFVFKYSCNKDTFERAAFQTLCDRLNDSIKVILYYSHFEDDRGYYKEGMSLSQDFTIPIMNCSWYSSRPDSIEVKYWIDDHTVRREIKPFDCDIWYLRRE